MKKRKPREWWAYNGEIFSTRKEARIVRNCYTWWSDDDEVIHVREVLKPKRRKRGNTRKS